MGTSHPFPAQVLIMLTLSSDVFEKIQRVSYSVYLVSFVNLASYITWACTLHYGLVQYFLSREHAGTARRLHLVRIQSIDESALRRRAPRAAQRASRIRSFQRRLSEHAAKARRASVWDRAAKESEIPNFKGSFLGRFPLVSVDFWTSDHLSERSRSVDAFPGTRARGTLTLKRR